MKLCKLAKTLLPACTCEIWISMSSCRLRSARPASAVCGPQTPPFLLGVSRRVAFVVHTEGSQALRTSALHLPSEGLQCKTALLRLDASKTGAAVPLLSNLRG